jgi:hypothetical protein
VVLLDTLPVSARAGKPERVAIPITSVSGAAHATEPAAEVLDAIPEDPDPGPRALDLLEDTMALALEGRPRPPDERGRRIRAPAPGQIAEILRRLVARGARYRGPRQLLHDLNATSAYQDEVTRLRRLGHLALLISFSSIWLMCCLPLFGFFVTPPFIAINAGYSIEGVRAGIRGNERLSADSQLALSTQQTDPFLRLSGAALFVHDQRQSRQLDEQRRRMAAEQNALLEDMSPIQRWTAATWISTLQAQQSAMEPSFEEARRRAMHGRDYRQIVAEQRHLPGPSFVTKDASSMKWAGLISLGAWPLLAILWAFCVRGGLSYTLAGIMIVRRDGRSASRFQCLWRAALFWAPIGLLLCLSVYHDFTYWEQWNPAIRGSARWMAWLSRIEWYTGVGLLLLGPVAALRYPQRSLHDRLAGTYLVPR